jgi:hypothetical protein
MVQMLSGCTSSTVQWLGRSHSDSKKKVMRSKCEYGDVVMGEGGRREQGDEGRDH